MLGPEIKAGDHLVFIEDHSSGHVPWHVIMGQIVPVSYAQSWSMLLRSEGVTTRKSNDGLGALMVPQSNDHERIVGPFQTAYAELETLAPRAEMRFLSAQGVKADRQAALDLIGRSYFVVLLCHGVYLDAESEVALLVADDGRLPPSPMAATASQPAPPSNRVS